MNYIIKAILEQVSHTSKFSCHVMDIKVKIIYDLRLWFSNPMEITLIISNNINKILKWFPIWYQNHNLQTYSVIFIFNNK